MADRPRMSSVDVAEEEGLPALEKTEALGRFPDMPAWFGPGARRIELFERGSVRPWR